MTNHDNLFRETDFVVGSQDPADPFVQFANHFGAARVFPVAGQAGPHPALLAELAGRLMTTRIDGMIVLSAAGAERMLEQSMQLADPDRFFSSLADSQKIVAGPNAARVLARRKIEANRVLTEATDWRSALKQLDSLPELANSRLAIESTVLDLQLQSGLEVRGTVVEPIAIVSPPIRNSKKDSDTPQCIAAITADLDGLAGIIDWLGESEEGNSKRPLLFSSSPEIVEVAGLLGMEPRLVETKTPPNGWGKPEAMQIARHLW